MFRCIPTDSVEKLGDLDAWRAQMTMAEFDPYGARNTLRRHVRGHLVLFPLYFLHKSDLSPSIVSKEGLAPTILFT